MFGSTIALNRFSGSTIKRLASLCAVPVLTLAGFAVVFAVSLALFPLLGLSFFPRTDAGSLLSISKPLRHHG